MVEVGAAAAESARDRRHQVGHRSLEAVAGAALGAERRQVAVREVGVVDGFVVVEQLELVRQVLQGEEEEEEVR